MIAFRWFEPLEQIMSFFMARDSEEFGRMCIDACIDQRIMTGKPDEAVGVDTWPASYLQFQYKDNWVTPRMTENAKCMRLPGRTKSKFTRIRSDDTTDVSIIADAYQDWWSTIVLHIAVLNNKQPVKAC